MQGEDDVERLLQDDSGIVKHRGKVMSVINNAKLVLDIQDEYGSLASYLWSLLPEGRPVINQWRCDIAFEACRCGWDLRVTV